MIEALASAAADGRPVRPVGGGTKRSWGTPAADVEELPIPGEELHEYNAGDLTAVVDPGVPLARLQERAAEAGQMLALDPPLGEGSRATLGGIVATNDSGPLRQGYGSARDLVVGITVGLPDGTAAKAGGKVIKNVAGYDLAKLFTGSYGALGAILRLSLRLHPLPAVTCTAVGRASDPAVVAAAAAELGHARIEQQSLDVRWEAGSGAVLSRMGGAAAKEPAKAAAAIMTEAGLEAELVEDDAELWERQREAQRSADATVVKVAALPTQLGALLATAERLGATVVGRAGHGLSWVTLHEAAVASLDELRRALAPSQCTVLDAPAEVREAVDVWGPQPAGVLALLRRVKERFDPAGVCNPGVLPGGI